MNVSTFNKKQIREYLDLVETSGAYLAVDSLTEGTKRLAVDSLGGGGSTPNATTEVAGKVELATEAEMSAGTEGKIPDAALIKSYVDENSGGGGGGTVQDSSTLSIMAVNEGYVVGDARGAGSIDLQTSRTLASQVASGPSSVITGGVENSAIGCRSTVSGGRMNTAIGIYSTVSGGHCNTASATYSTIGGGYANIASGIHSTVSGGYHNTASATYSTIGGGHRNIVSKNFSTVGGGRNNNVSGCYSVVSGGWCNNACGCCSTVSGGYRNNACVNATVGGGAYNNAIASLSTVGGGRNNTASATYSTISGGGNNNACESYSTVGGGGYNSASGYYSTVGGGRNNTSIGCYSIIGGGYCNTTCGKYSAISGGNYAIARRFAEQTHSAGCFSIIGDSQRVDLISRIVTINDLATELLLDGISLKASITLNTALFATINIAGVLQNGSKAAHYVRKVAIKNVAGTTSLIGAVSTIGTDVEDDAGYDVSITADDTNNSLSIKVTGKTNETIRWLAHIQGVEIGIS